MTAAVIHPLAMGLSWEYDGVKVRWPIAAVALFLAAVAFTAAFVGRYARNELLDTDRFVAVATPLAADPAARRLVADEVTDQVTRYLTSAPVTSQIAGLAERIGLRTDSVTGRVSGVVRQYVERYLDSAQFRDLWGTLVRLAHGDVVRIMAGEPGQTLAVKGRTVTIEIGPVVSAVRAALVRDGVPLAARIPDVERRVTIAESPYVADVRSYGRLFERYGRWLPAAALALLAVGLVLAPRRLTALAATAGLAALLVAAVAIVVPRLRGRVAGNAGTDAGRVAGSVFDALADPLVRVAWLTAGALVVLGLATGYLAVRHRV